MPWRTCAPMAAAVLLLCACGGEETPEEAFRAEVDAVCVEGTERADELLSENDAPLPLPAYTDFLLTRNQISEDVLSELEGIDPPAVLTGQYERLIADQRAVVANGERALDAAKRRDERALQRVEKEYGAIQKADSEVALGLGLFACANRLPPEDEADLRAAIESIWTRADPAHCTEDYTSDLVDVQLGGQEACEKGETPAGEADSLEITNVSGTEGVSAEAQVTLHGGSNDGEMSVQTYRYEDGRWKLDRITETQTPEPVG